MGEKPFLRIVRGEPTAEELAALIAVVTVRARITTESADGRPGRVSDRVSGWADRSRLVRRPVVPGPGAWRAGAFRS